MGTQANFKSKPLTDISSYLDASTIQFLDVKNRNEAISKLTDCLVSCYNLEESKDEFLQAVLEREKVASTGIGVGVAIPHAKLSEFDDFFVAIGILKTGINWNSMDNVDVKLIFLIAGPDDKQCDYLNLLSQLTIVLRDEEVRKKILSYSSPKQIIETFKRAKGEF
ncbi:MAG: PTS system fructose-specific EIIABC component [Chlamydiae bacterium]|nr:PTS system fructose-specific EIIABC component [Chlamydiota bacterium]